MMEVYCPQAIPYCNPDTLEAEANYNNAFTTGGLYKGDGQKMGLYNVGIMVGDMYSNLYSFFIQGFNYGSTCITFGYMTGKHIMAQA